MEMKDNNKNKVLLSVLGVAILLVAVVGISFAAYTNSMQTKTNTISLGTIMVSYTEPEGSIKMTDVMPIDDATGKTLSGVNKTFDFTVATKASSNLTIPYEINLTKESVTGTALSDGEVKVYLTDQSDGFKVGPKLVSALATSKVRPGSKVLYQTEDVFSGTFAEKQTKYRLRMWVDKGAYVDGSTKKSYKVKVNVNSNVTPISK